MANPLIVNPYANRKYTKKELAAIPDLRPAISEVGKGVRAFADETQATGYGLYALGAQHLKDTFGAGDDSFLGRQVKAGQEGYARNIEEATAGRQAPAVARIEDIKGVGNLTDWAAYNLAKGVPQLGMLAIGAGAGGVIAKGLVKKKLKDVAKVRATDAVSKKMQQDAKDEIRKQVGRGVMAGGFAAGSGMEAGHMMGQALEKGVAPSRAKVAATVGGGLAGAMEFAAPFAVAKTLGRAAFAKKGIRDIIKNDPGLSKKAVALAAAKEAGQRAGKAGALGAGTEGITEGMQELVNIASLRWAEGDPMFADLSADDWSQVKNSMAAGALIGGSVAGTGGPLAGKGVTEAEAKIEVDPAKPVEPVITPPEEVILREPGTQGKLVDEPVITPMHPERREPEVPVQPVAQVPGLEQKPLQGEIIDEETGRALVTQDEQAQLESPFIEGRLSPEELLAEQKKLEEQGRLMEQKLLTEQRKLPAPSELQSVARPPMWHSRVAQTVAASPQAKMQGKQWQGWLGKQPGIKPEEIEDLGLKEWLGEREGAVSREEVEEFVKAGGVQLEEVTRGFEETSPDINLVTQTGLRVEQHPTDPEMIGFRFDLNDDFLSADEIQRFRIEGDSDFANITNAHIQAMRRIEEQTKEPLPIPKYGEHQVPGGENYKELLLTLPTKDKGADFKSSHFDEPNILAHVRFNEREDDGQRALFVEEVQSDWHQAGRKEGYKKELTPDDFIVNQLTEGEFTFQRKDKEGLYSGFGDTVEEAFADIKKHGLADLQQRAKVPDAPFKSAWPLLAMKRVIRYAVENGFDKVAWTPGQVQADRYDLSKQIDSVFVRKFNNEYMLIISKNEQVLSESTVPENGLVEAVGKGLAKKITQDLENNGAPKEYAGLDLQVGGEGMKSFYDKGLPRAMNKYLKQWDIKAEIGRAGVGQDVWTFPVTQQMREDILTKGQPLYSETQNEEVVFGQEGQNRKLHKALGLREGGPEEQKVFTEETDRVFGAGFVKQAVDSGLLTVNETSPEGSAAGTFDREGGTITINLDRIDKGETALSVLLHEGRHAGLESVLGESLPLFHTDLLDLASRGNEDAQHSVTRSTAAVADLLGIKHDIYDLTLPPKELAKEVQIVREQIMQSKPELLVEEDLAYYIQDSANNPELVAPGLFRRLVNALKVWWAQSNIGQLLAQKGLRAELSSEMAVELAKASIRKSAQDFGKQAEVTGELVAGELQSIASQWEGFKRKWATDEEFNLGVGQRMHTHIIDNLATIDMKDTDVHKVAEVAKSKTSAKRSTINRLFLEPIVEMARKTGLSREQLDEWFVARNILLDDENWQNVQKRSWMFAKDLGKHIPNKMQKEIDEKRTALTQRDDISTEEIQDAMVELVDEYMAEMQELQDKGEVAPEHAEWERYRDDWAKVKAHSAGMYSPGKVGADGKLLDPTKLRDNVSNAPNALNIYHEHLANPELQRMARKMDEMGEYQLDMLVEGEKITQEEKAILRGAHPHYVKTRRESADIDSSFDFLTDPNVSSGGLKVRAGTVEYDKPVHVLQNTFAQAHAFAGAAQQNLAAKYLYERVIADKEGWRNWFNTAPKHIRRLDRLGFMHDRPTTHQDRTAIPVTIIAKDGKAGESHFIQPVQQNLRAKLFGAAMNKLGAQQQGAISKILGFGNKIVRMTAVTFSTSFMAANLFRDPTTALYNLQATEGKDWTKEFLWGSEKSKRTGLKNAYKILMDVYFGDRAKADPKNIGYVEEWEDAGGRQSFTQSLREMDSGWGSFEKELWKMKTPGIRQATTALEMIEKVNILVENVSRFSAFSTVMDAWERGDIPKWKNRDEARREAALISKEITTNFDRKGFSSSAIGLWHIFFNAAVQGNVQVLRNLRKSGKLQAMVTGSIITATVFDVIGRELFSDDDEWDNIPEYIKERNIVLPIKIGGQFVKIPSPWVYNTVWRVGGMMGEVMTGNRDAVSMPLETVQLMYNTFNPMNSATWAQTLSPTTLDPFTQAIENKNWAGNPIKPTSFPGAAALPESELYWDTTPDTYKSIAKMLNALTGGDVGHSGLIDISPGVIHNTMNFFTAGVGKTLGQMYNLVDGVTGDHEVTVRDVPFLSSYLEAPGSKVEVQLYHQHVAQILQADKTVSLYGKGKTMDREKERESKITYRKELRMVSQAKDVERQLKSLRTRKRAAQGRKDKAGIERVQKQILAVQKRFNDTFERRMK